ncbi:MAG: hypothetical protein HQ518_20365 [Rhodopirellula sp.]|nr:hypothetical protein [Rhodopirellula sp.]
MNHNIEKLDRLHSIARQALEAAKEVEAIARNLSTTRGKVSKRKNSQLQDQFRKHNQTFYEFHTEANSDVMIKIWFMLWDVWYDVCRGHNRPSPIIGWNETDEIDAMHCHEALQIACSTIGHATSQIGLNDASLEDVAELLTLPMVEIVCSSEFATALNEEANAARNILKQCPKGEIPLSVAAEHSARLRIVHRVSDKAQSCAGLSAEFVDRYRKDPLLSTDAWAANSQARQNVDTAVLMIDRIRDVRNSIERVPDCDVAFETIKEANLATLAPITVGVETFPTAHDAAIGEAELVCSVFHRAEGIPEREWLIDLSKRLDSLNLPNLYGLMLIELARADAWLDKWLAKQQTTPEIDVPRANAAKVSEPTEAVKETAALTIYPETAEPPDAYCKDGRPIGPLIGNRTALGFALHKADNRSDVTYRKQFVAKVANGTVWVRESTHSRQLEMFVQSFPLRDTYQERLEKFVKRK